MKQSELNRLIQLASFMEKRAEVHCFSRSWAAYAHQEFEQNSADQLQPVVNFAVGVQEIALQSREANNILGMLKEPSSPVVSCSNFRRCSSAAESTPATSSQNIGVTIGGCPGSLRALWSDGDAVCGTRESREVCIFIQREVWKFIGYRACQGARLLGIRPLRGKEGVALLELGCEVAPASIRKIQNHSKRCYGITLELKQA
ncbi:uncharacterized protein LOC124651633 [Lolium rigidum]|uniref:uncharacterized protein LOC124651633 n=1 Tax=Lolium rigidum TaxID=89674 RepID=UPI001F5D4176|nr:uncharacterized protein LOC124651633 [Lolium rigidum]